MITKEQWLELCKKLNKYCSYGEIQDTPSIEQAENYMKNMPVWMPMIGE
ncbi:hypothetical protein [Butyrivibrio proteoclasticus]|nr:hypothetical protein [Butyrivibrio proteoclasticus]